MSGPNPANLSRESRRILNENVIPSGNITTASPTIPKPFAPGFVDDATEIALSAYDGTYTAEYTASGAIDNKTVAMRAAVEAVIALCTMDAEAEQSGIGVREQVELAGDHLVIRVPIGAFAIAAPLAWEKHAGRDLSITDLPMFAKEILSQLRQEKENGDTLVTDMLDAAVIRAVEYGALKGAKLGGAER